MILKIINNYKRQGPIKKCTLNDCVPAELKCVFKFSRNRNHFLLLNFLCEYLKTSKKVD